MHHKTGLDIDFGLGSSSSSAASTNSKSTCAQLEEGFLVCQVGSLCMLRARQKEFGVGGLVVEERSRPEQAGARKHETHGEERQSKHGQGSARACARGIHPPPHLGLMHRLVPLAIRISPWHGRPRCATASLDLLVSFNWKFKSLVDFFPTKSTGRPTRRP